MTSGALTEPVIEEAAPPPAPRPTRRLLTSSRWPDLPVAVGYLAGAVALFWQMCAAPTTRVVGGGNGQDTQLFFWFFAHAARSVTHLENPLFSNRQNVPDGVNMMANATTLGLGIPATPVTLLFGPGVTFVTLSTLALAGTAFGWYLLFSRQLTRWRPAAVLAGAWCGFAPPMFYHAPGHLQITAQFLVPAIVLCVLRLGEPTHVLRRGLVLGGLVTWQAFISEEILLLTALTCVFIVGAYSVAQPRRIWAMRAPALRSGAIAVAVAGVLLAYPVWFQFNGPGTYRGLPYDGSAFTTDLSAYARFSGTGLVGDPTSTAQLAAHTGGEVNAFFGWPVLLVALACLVIAWRVTLARILALTALVAGVLSLGSTISFNGHLTRWPGPYRLVANLPPFDLALPTRFSMVLVPVIGALIALAGDRIGQYRGDRARLVRLGAVAVLVAALLPVVPKPLVAVEVPATPAFIASGEWRRYVPEGRTLVPVPLPRFDALDGMRWSAQQDLAFALPRGFFLGPDGTPQRHTLFEAPPRPTSDLLFQVAATGEVPEIGPRERQAAQDDLRYWRAAVVVLAPPQPHQDALLAVLTSLLGPGTQTGGVWLWTVEGPDEGS